MDLDDGLDDGAGAAGAQNDGSGKLEAATVDFVPVKKCRRCGGHFIAVRTGRTKFDGDRAFCDEACRDAPGELAPLPSPASGTPAPMTHKAMQRKLRDYVSAALTQAGLTVDQAAAAGLLLPVLCCWPWCGSWRSQPVSLAAVLSLAFLALPQADGLGVKMVGYNVVVAAFKADEAPSSAPSTMVYLSNKGMKGARGIKSVLHMIGKVSHNSLCVCARVGAERQ